MRCEPAIKEWIQHVISIVAIVAKLSFAHLQLRLSNHNKCCDQGVKAVPHKKSLGCVKSIVQRRDVDTVAWSALYRMCDAPQTGYVLIKNSNHMYWMWSEQAIRVSMACDLYCCFLPHCEALHTCWFFFAHKLCTLAGQVFQSQH